MANVTEAKRTKPEEQETRCSRNDVTSHMLVRRMADRLQKMLEETWRDIEECIPPGNLQSVEEELRAFSEVYEPSMGPLFLPGRLPAEWVTFGTWRGTDHNGVEVWILEHINVMDKKPQPTVPFVSKPALCNWGVDWALEANGQLRSGKWKGLIGQGKQPEQRHEISRTIAWMLKQ